jgi:hypothetical protein
MPATIVTRACTGRDKDRTAMTASHGVGIVACLPL